LFVFNDGLTETGSTDPVLFGSVVGGLGEMDLDQFISVNSDDD